MGQPGNGRFQTYAYTFKLVGKMTVFIFTPPLPMSDVVVNEAMRHILVTDFGADLKGSSMAVEGASMRFKTSGGAWDVAPMKDAGVVVSLVVERPK